MHPRRCASIPSCHEKTNRAAILSLWRSSAVKTHAPTVTNVCSNGTPGRRHVNERSLWGCGMYKYGRGSPPSKFLLPRVLIPSFLSYIYTYFKMVDRNGATVVIILFPVLATLCVAARLVARVKILRNPGWEDGIIVLSLVGFQLENKNLMTLY